MPTAIHSEGLIDRVSFLQYAGCCGTSDLGSATRSSSLGSDATISCVRLTSQQTLPRHSTLIFWPGSILLMSTSIGAPAALARSLGHSDITNGTAAATTPTPPTTDVAPIRNRRLSLFTIASVPIPAFRRALSPRCKTFELYVTRHARLKPVDEFLPDYAAETAGCRGSSAGTDVAGSAAARRVRRAA